jgi:hypothetical protein
MGQLADKRARIQHVDVDCEVSRFTRAAFMHDTSDGIIGIKEWISRHARGEFLLDFDILDLL